MRPMTTWRLALIAFVLCALLASGFADDVLEPKLKKTPQPNYAGPVPSRVSGRVVWRKQETTLGAEGVSVTDGYSVTKTNSQGEYSLTPNAQAVFVYITRPSKFDVEGDWYKPLAPTADFALKPAADDETEYTFVHVTDTHVSENPTSLAGLSRFVQEVNSLFGYHLGQKQIRVNGQNLEYPTNEVQPMHVEWMRQDMAHRKAGTFVVTTSEADLTRHCPGFLEMARQNDVRLQLVGDDHIVAYKARAVPYRTGGALSGCWWTPAARELCPDLSHKGI